MEPHHRASLPSLRPMLRGGAPIRALAARSVQVGGAVQPHVQTKHKNIEATEPFVWDREAATPRVHGDITFVLQAVRHFVSGLVGRQQLGLAQRKLLRLSIGFELTVF